MRCFRLISLALLAALLMGAPARAQSTIDGLPPVPVFPFPDPAVTHQNAWMTQGGLDYKATVTQLGHIWQGNCAILQVPFINQLCWDTTAAPVILKQWNGTVWGPPITISTGPTQPFACVTAKLGQWWIDTTTSTYLYKNCDGNAW